MSCQTYAYDHLVVVHQAKVGHWSGWVSLVHVLEANLLLVWNEVLRHHYYSKLGSVRRLGG